VVSDANTVDIMLQGVQTSQLNNTQEKL